MVYKITRYIFKKAFAVFYQKVTVIGKENLPSNAPVILALNHPNSFMDALIVAVNIDAPINSLTRGDVFKNKTAAKILRTYHMIPVYRLSEGKEHLNKNSDSFNACQSVLQNNGTVLIFAEGICENNWKLRPLKKGVARLTQQAWQNTDTAKTIVIPVGLTYQHYKGAGKSLVINFGKALTKKMYNENIELSNFYTQFNEELYSRLNELVFVDNKLTMNSILHQKFITNWNKLEGKLKGVELIRELKKGFNETEIKSSKKLIPSAIHASLIFIPHYWICASITNRFTKNTVFYDSVLFGLLVFLLPVYVLILISVYYLILHFI